MCCDKECWPTKVVHGCRCVSRRLQRKWTILFFFFFPLLLLLLFRTTSQHSSSSFKNEEHERRLRFYPSSAAAALYRLVLLARLLHLLLILLPPSLPYLSFLRAAVHQKSFCIWSTRLHLGVKWAGFFFLRIVFHTFLFFFLHKNPQRTSQAQTAV